ncbi:hypothetical protein NP493_817g00018, partial [Ridgeia piscesae]
TFRQRKKNGFPEGTLRYDLHKKANASLHSGIDLKQVVRLPPNEDLNDWLAVHVVDFFNRINVIYGIVCEFCTERTCPAMSGGPKYEYHWCDGIHYKKPTKLPAPQYIGLLMEWVEAQINNEELFPLTVDGDGLEPHVNTCYKHFYYFVTEFNIVEKKELEPLVGIKPVLPNLACRHLC